MASTFMMRGHQYDLHQTGPGTCVENQINATNHSAQIYKDQQEGCLLCGSRIELSQIPCENRKKYSINICTLYEIIDERQIELVEQITSDSVYCIVCYQELQEIENLYTAIARFNAKLQVMKVECKTKLKDIIYSQPSCSINANLNHNQNSSSLWSHQPQHPRSGEGFVEMQSLSQREKLYRCFQGFGISEADLVPYQNQNPSNISYSTENIECIQMEVEVDPRPEMDLMKFMENIEFANVNHQILNIPNDQINDVVEVQLETPHVNENGPESRPHDIQQNSENEISFLCSYPGCQMAFTIEARREGHYNRAHKKDPRPYKCTQCTCSFLSYNELVEHGNVHLGLNPFSCSECDQKFPTKLRLNRHKRHHHRPKGAQCKYCGKSFLYDGRDLERHLMSHTGKDLDHNKILQCELCGITYRDIRQLHGHLNREHPNSDAVAKIYTFKCRYCDKVFTRKYYLQIHERTHEGYETENVESEIEDEGIQEPDPAKRVKVRARRIKSEIVSNSFDSGSSSELDFGSGSGYSSYNAQGNPKNGYRQEEDESYQALREQFNLKPLSIPLKKLPLKDTLKVNKETEAMSFNDNNISTSTFAASGNLKTRVRKKYRPRQKRPKECAKYPSTLKQIQYPFPCPYQNCKSKYLVEILLEGHIKKRHLGVNRPYECEICHTTWISHSELMQHGNVHLGLTPFDCQDCGEKFATKNLLGAHRRKTHRDKEVVCGHCGKKFLYACANYRVHVRRHLNERSFKCDLCGEAFFAKAELTQHQRIYHEGEVVDKRMFKCQFCDKSYNRPQFLKRHEFLAHSSSSPYNSGKGKRDMNNKNADETWITSSNEFRCHVCGLKAEDQENLDDHLSSEHSEDDYRPFKCEVCGFAFKFFGERNRHRRVKHGLVEFEFEGEGESQGEVDHGNH